MKIQITKLPKNRYDIGGVLQSHGADWGDGLVHINAGSSHELNPNEGVQMGVDQNGVPNLVEEGETVFNDYVYSNRIIVDDDTKKRYGINKKRQITFAELSKKLEKEASERPNDPISQAGLNASMSDLADAQEAEKMRLEAERAKEAFNSLSPEEQTALMQNVVNQGNVNAYGGNLYAQGGNANSMYETQRQDRFDEAYMWLLNNPHARLMSVEDIEKVAQLIVNEYYDSNGTLVWSPEKLFKKIVPTVGFDKSNLQRYLKEYKDENISPEGAMYLATMFAPENVNTKIWRDSVDKLKKEYTDNYNQKNNVGNNVAANSSEKNIVSDSPAAALTSQDSTGQKIDPTLARINNWTQTRNSPAPFSATTIAPTDTVVVPSSVNVPVVEQPIVQQPVAQDTVTMPTSATVSPEVTPIGLRPYGYDSIEDFEFWNPETSDYDTGYLDFVNSINQDWVDKILAGDYGNMNRYLGANKDYKITPEEVITLATDKKYSDMHKAVAAAYKDHLAGLNSSAEGISEPAAEPAPVSKRDTQVYIATDKGIIPVDASTLDDSYTIEDFDGVKIARKAPQKVGETPAQTEEETVAEETGIKPDLKKETYMGLFGPAVGLGMMSAGIGRPNYRELDAALTSARTAPRRAGYATIGDYLRYTPMDIWAEQNRLDANARAADRALMAGNSPSRYAGILANNYNAQLASGDIYRKAVEYNDAKKAQVADFNRGTNQYNADAFTRNSQFNAESANRANQFATSVALNVAQQKMANEADWYNSLYGNVYGLFDRVNQWEKWKRDHNTVAQMYANGLAGVVDEDTPVAMGYVKKGAKGGKLRKKGKNDLTL